MDLFKLIDWISVVCASVMCMRRVRAKWKTTNEQINITANKWMNRAVDTILCSSRARIENNICSSPFLLLSDEKSIESDYISGFITWNTAAVTYVVQKWSTYSMWDFVHWRLPRREGERESVRQTKRERKRETGRRTFNLIPDRIIEFCENCWWSTVSVSLPTIDIVFCVHCIQSHIKAV